MTVPVLIIVFNRPDTTAEVFQAVRDYRPRQLFIAQDGPRPVPGEAERCAAVRAIVEGVDWDCDVRHLYRDENLGCGRAVSEAVTWFFEQVEEGVILEDDCVPAPAFFPYCEELLERHRNDQRVWMISGVNLLGRWRHGGASYFFADGGVWGWATWRRAWEQMDLRPPAWHDPERRARAREFLGEDLWGVVAPELERVFRGDLDTWDYQWLFLRASHGGAGAIPSVNLVRNIGFRADATHTTDTTTPYTGLSTGTLAGPIRHPADVVVDRRYMSRVVSRRRQYARWLGARRRLRSLRHLGREAAAQR
jgi:hypothetical protein